MYGSMEQSTPAAAPALGPEEVKFVRKLMATNGDDAQSRDSSTSTLPTVTTQSMTNHVEKNFLTAVPYTNRSATRGRANAFCLLVMTSLTCATR